MINRRWLAIAWLAGGVAWANETPRAMSQEQVESFISNLKKGAPVEITLAKGHQVKGVFSSYDDYYETVWLIPQGDPGMFKEKGLKISGIKSITAWERTTANTTLKKADPHAPPEVTNDDYYLLREDIQK
jgi:hypothetical protein